MLADIGDRQSIEMSLSTFSGHIANLVEILDAATDRSLVLVDEIASGTDPVEGSALAQALVERLAQQARLTVVTTHYPELKEWASARDDAVNAATSLDPETNAPNYRITLGRPGISHALQTAERLGLDESVVAAARERVAPERLRIGELLAETEAAERSASSVLAAARASRGARAGRARRALEAEIEKVRASAERERELAAADAQRELADARVELQALRDDMREARRRKRDQPAVDRALGAASTRAANAERALRDLEPLPVLTPLAPGDPVESDVGVRGTIASISGDEAEVVGSGGHRVRIALARLRPHAAARRVERARRQAERDDQRRRLGRDRRARPARAGGARGGARFVDEAALAGLSSVRVIHGRGTGSVRAAVRDELDKHPLVDRREPEANDGATLAHLSVVRYIGRENVRKRFEPLEGTPGHTVYAGGEVRIDDVVVRPTFGLAHEGEYDHVHVGPLLEEIARDHLVAVLLVRLGGYAVGMLEGERIVTSKVGSRFVKNRHKKGGSSANRFRRRREEQAKALIEEAAEVAASVLVARAVRGARRGQDRGRRCARGARRSRRGCASGRCRASSPWRSRGCGRCRRCRTTSTRSGCGTNLTIVVQEANHVRVVTRERHPPRRGVLRRRLRDRDHAARARPDACPSSRAGELLHDLAHLWGAYIAYVSSFLYIGVIWLNHHNAFTRIHRIDRNLQWANLGCSSRPRCCPSPPPCSRPPCSPAGQPTGARRSSSTR